MKHCDHCGGKKATTHSLDIKPTLPHGVMGFYPDFDLCSECAGALNLTIRRFVAKAANDAAKLEQGKDGT